jgi:protein-S-isoprenylcysteine O-methyltransferase Ste14
MISFRLSTEKESVFMKNIFINLGKFFFKYRDGLFPAIYIGLLLFIRPALFLGDAQSDRYVCVAGVLILLVGQIFRIIVIGFAYIERGGREGKVFAESLVKTGFFAHVRNPMYVGNYLIVVGLVMLYGAVEAYLYILPFFLLVYYSIVLNEEDYLKDKFGQEYEDYAAKVNRFIPDFRGIRKSLETYKFNWLKVLRKEHGSIFFITCAWLSIIIWKDITIFGYDQKQPEINILLMLFIPVVLFYGITLYLKLRGHLDKGL